MVYYQCGAANAYKGLDESLKAVPHWLKTIQYGNGSEQVSFKVLLLTAQTATWIPPCNLFYNTNECTENICRRM